MNLNRSTLNTSRTSEAEDEEEEEDAFFDMLTRVQADRLDDQRCQMPKNQTAKNAKSVRTCAKNLPTRANSLPASSYSKKKLQLVQPGQIEGQKSMEFECFC